MFFYGSIRRYGTKINVQNKMNIARAISVPHLREDAALTQREQEPVQQLSVQEQYIVNKNWRDREERLERRWRFLTSIDADPIIIDGYVFRFDYKLYTNVID